MDKILYTIIAAIAFLIPGVIVTSIVKRVIPIVDKEYKTIVLENFIYSFINIFLWSIPIYNIYLNIEWWKQNYVFLWLVGILIIFLSPITIALIIIVFNQYELFRRICNYFNISFTDTDPSAWDFKFKRIENEWVIVTLKDEKIIAGFLGNNSFISSNARERDLYIDEVYEIRKKGKWRRRRGTDGIWLSSEEIKSIEFLHYDRKGGEENGKI